MSTIQIGIDLGTTNSSVAIVKKDHVEIIKNSVGEESTPSVVLADRNGNIIVGSKAKRTINNSKDNLQNSMSEVKRLMGTGETIYFPRLNKEMLPEEISAEILKSLRNDIQRKDSDILLDAAVITVPAYFSTVQSEATKRSGILAGFKEIILLQEPIAAAIAYGFLNEKNENWLVYDLGGGTFDVALVALRDGFLNVLSHAGDNFLGGKDFDTAIIENLIIPSLSSKDINLDRNIHAHIFSRLKELAETAKIELTVNNTSTIDIDIEVNENKIEYSLTISRQDLLNHCKHLLDRTIELCKKTISDAKVDPSTVKKIVLVGGPTQMPILRDFLKDSLNTTVDGSLDPLTVVAKGAAMYGNQKIITIKNDNSDVANTHCQLELNYNPVTSDDEQTLTGKIIQCPKEYKPHSIQFTNSEGSFTSEDIIIKNGKFILTIPTIDQGSQYWIYVKDSKNQLIDCSPDNIYIKRGISITGAPLPYSIGVSVISLSRDKGYADISETMEFFFSKNSILPLKAKKRFHTMADVKAGSAENGLPICIYEGESFITNRNTLVCHLAIIGKSLIKDLKRGSPVDITIEINESRELSVRAYLPDADITLNARKTLYFNATKIEETKKDFLGQVSRSESLLHNKEKSSEVDFIRNLIRSIQATIERPGNDSDQERKAEKQVKDLMIALDQMEAKTKYNTNVSEFWIQCEKLTNYLEDCQPVENEGEYKTIYNTLRKEGISAIEKQDAVWLEHIIQKLAQLYDRCQLSDPRILSQCIQQMIQEAQEKEEPHSSLPELIIKAQNALDNSDIGEMQKVVFSLHEITKEETKLELKFIKSGIWI